MKKVQCDIVIITFAEFNYLRRQRCSYREPKPTAYRLWKHSENNEIRISSNQVV